MSAAEVIEQVAKLPSEEQEKVFAYLEKARRHRQPDDAGTRYADDAAFDKAADKVLREHAELFRRLAQ
jgi:hypothetical protein